jgi:hypothetical protein
MPTITKPKTAGAKILRIDTVEDFRRELSGIGDDVQRLFLKTSREDLKEAMPAGHASVSELKARLLAEEYSALVSLHDINNGGFPRPITSIKNSNNQLLGYFSEFIAGYTLGECICGYRYLDESSIDMTNSDLRIMVPDVVRQIGNILLTVHAHRQAHGDVHSDNIMVTMSGKGMLIDPYPHSGIDFYNPPEVDISHFIGLVNGLERNGRISDEESRGLISMFRILPKLERH